jgi:anti-sigma regulatory factor (Ser/Thr protein kinase)
MCTTAQKCERPARELEIQLAADEMAPRKARQFVRHHFERLGYPGFADDATVVVSELVTNAVTAAPWAPVFVSLLPASGRVVLEVWDMSPYHPEPRDPDPMATGGRGLRVVAELSVTFGCEQKGPWKAVWALFGGTGGASLDPYAPCVSNPTR